MKSNLVNAMRRTSNGMRRVAWGLPAALCVWLVGCAGTIKQDPRVQGDVSRLEGVVQVSAQMSPDALKQQADNPQFSREELASFLRRRLESKGLVAAAATHQVQIVVTDIRVRSGVAAILFGALAGDDHVTGRVRVLDAQGRAVRGFEVHATYALGGVGGGQDGVRMNWLYDKFSELAATELEKVISPPRANMALAPTSAPTNALAITPASAPAVSPVITPPVSPATETAAALDNADVVPVGEKGRAAYRDWLTQKTPRAFIVAESGHWYGTWGKNPKDPMEPADPTERAMKRCQDAGRPQCTPYAVDHRLLYVKPGAATAR